MSVVVSVQEVGPCRKQLKIEVPAPAVEAEASRVLQDFSRKARVPGFRPGKAPREMVRARFQGDIEREVVDRLMPRYWKQAEAESSLEPLLAPDVDEVDPIKPGEPWTFTATVEVRPEIELRNYKDFELPEANVEVGTMEVDDAIEELRRQTAPWVPVEHAAVRGDKVTARITPLSGEEGEGATPPEPQEIDVEIGDQRVWEELSLALTGLSAGQETTFSHRDEHDHGPDEGHDHEHPERRFRVEVVEVQERDLPALDEAFAAKIHKSFTTFSELKDDVTARIRSGKEQQRREQRQQALLTQLGERHSFQLPEGVVRREVENLVQDYARSLAQRGVDVEHAHIHWNEIAEKMQPMAEKRVRERLLLDAIATTEEVAVSEEEFERALAHFARQQGTTTSALRKSLDDNGRLNQLRGQLRREKTLRRLLGDTEPLDGI